MSAPPRFRHSPRRGFTLLELMLAVTLTLMVFAVMVPFLIRQSRSTVQASGRIDATQNARFAQDAIDRDLRMIGVGTLDGQPMLVQADRLAVTFNADLTTRDSLDSWAIYYNPDASASEVVAWQKSAPLRALPRSAVIYPDTTYSIGAGAPGPAETISYWLALDAMSPRPDEYVLWRRVNGADSSRVTAGLYVPPGKSFFSYSYVKDTLGTIDSVRASMLPLYHTQRVHGSAGDTGTVKRLGSTIDRIRSVNVQAIGLFQDRGGDTTMKRMAQGITTLVNANMLNRRSCGLNPSAPTSVRAEIWWESPDTSITNTNNGHSGEGNNGNGKGNYVVRGKDKNGYDVDVTVEKVTITWAPSTDEMQGERDVDRYLIYRRRDGTTLGEPLVSVPSGTSATYAYDDFDLAWTTASKIGAAKYRRGMLVDPTEYVVVAQDCQPQVSPPAAAPIVEIPLIP